MIPYDRRTFILVKAGCGHHSWMRRRFIRAPDKIGVIQVKRTYPTQCLDCYGGPYVELDRARVGVGIDL